MASSFVDSHRCNQCFFFFFFFFFLLLLLLLLQLGACKASLPSPASTIGRHGSSSSSRGRPRISSPAPAITALCRTTAYPQQCTRILSTLPSKAPLTRQIIAVSAYALRLTNFTYSAVVRDTTKQRSWDQSQIRGHGRGDKLASGALQDCIDLMGNSMDQLHISISKISGIVIPARGKAQIRASHARVMDAQVSLSAAYTFQDTCQDEINGHHDASYAAALLIKQSGPITQTIAVGLSLAETLQHKILHP